MASLELPYTDTSIRSTAEEAVRALVRRHAHDDDDAALLTSALFDWKHSAPVGSVVSDLPRPYVS